MATDKPTGRGGAGRNQGRKASTPGEPLSHAVTVKLSDRQKAKLDRLGGAPWVRERIDEAPESVPEEEKPASQRP